MRNTSEAHADTYIHKYMHTYINTYINTYIHIARSTTPTRTVRCSCLLGCAGFPQPVTGSPCVSRISMREVSGHRPRQRLLCFSFPWIDAAPEPHPPCVSRVAGRISVLCGYLDLGVASSDQLLRLVRISLCVYAHKLCF